ncbi:putative zinc finger protein [Scophthalmus maximus]|uniref:Poly [ADP-ribose] polymerase n=1 Tax=Scophthalmus maximus TaxID=52904 RepID=A0A2U9B2N1_SCOMX|nr:putative zinc finger protein [Scophthalmus maximus]
MAGRLSLPEVDLSCPICCDIFRDPVVLKCSHSFCAPCLQQYWTPRGPGSGPGSGRDCPLCRSQSVDDPVPSLSLRNLCESYLEREGEEAAPGEERAAELQGAPGEMCPLHGERLKLFCLPDKVPICVVCHTSRKHKQHDCCPVGEAAADAKEKMKSALGSLQEKRDAFERMKQNYEDTVAHIQVQARFVERRTREEFEKLRGFLRAEEEGRMEELRADEEQKRRAMARKIEEIEGSIATVSASIRDLEEEMALDDISVLHKCKRTLERADSPGEEPPLMPPAALIDVAKYVGSLSFHVWEKMHRIVKYSEHKVHMQKQHAASEEPLERHLFHGTTRGASDGICHNNFDPRVAGANGVSHGFGSYFATAAARSNNYSAKGDLDDVRHMFLAKVLVGKACVGRSNYRRPPPLKSKARPHKLYDTCVDVVDRPTMFVVYDSCQCYPYYLIKYRDIPNLIDI